METEHQLCIQFEAEFASIAALDRVYYLSPCPTLDERRSYAARQDYREELRSQLYAELAVLRQIKSHRRCRTVIRVGRSCHL